MELKELVSVYKTLKGEEEKFKEINCFFCNPRKMYVTPEGCFKLICRTVVEMDHSPCFNCKQDLIKEFSSIGIKRMKARNFSDFQNLRIDHIVKEMVSNAREEASRFFKENKQQHVYAIDCAENKIVYKKALPRPQKPIEKQSA